MAGKKPPQSPGKGSPEDGPEVDVAEPRDTLTASMFGDDVPLGPAVYQVLARKYRPTRFEDLVGQEAMVRTLTNAFKTGRIAHAFMLTGVRGVGKTTTARLLARALNYETKDVHQPSMQLDPQGVHCASIMAGTHPDVLELDAASNTGIDNMRDLLSGSRYAPVSARYKVYVIDEVHMLSTAAFNALLKTLEEPPPHVKFIFATTEIRKVPVTVLSRCQRFNLQRFSTEALTEHLANISKKEGAKVSGEALALIARAAEGSARDGLSILDQAIVQGEGGEVTAEQLRDMLGLADRSRVLDLMDRVIAADHKAALNETAALLEQGADAPVLIKDLMDVVVEISRAQALKDAYAFSGPQEWAKRTKAMGELMSPAQSARMWRLLLQGFEDCARAPDPPTAAQMVVLRLTAVTSLPSPEDAARMLAAGGAAVPSPKSQPEAPRAPERAERAVSNCAASARRSRRSRAAVVPARDRGRARCAARDCAEIRDRALRAPRRNRLRPFPLHRCAQRTTQPVPAHQGLAGRRDQRRVGSAAVQRWQRREREGAAHPQGRRADARDRSDPARGGSAARVSRRARAACRRCRRRGRPGRLPRKPGRGRRGARP